jgi:hypothetical protein
MKCPKCNSDMKDLGLWPDSRDGGKIKQTFVCDSCAPPGGACETVRITPSASNDPV